MKTKVDRYLHNAEECRRDATQAANRREKRGYLKIAEYWSKMAKKIDRQAEPDSDAIQSS
jgi:hypothetical protein